MPKGGQKGSKGKGAKVPSWLRVAAAGTDYHVPADCLRMDLNTNLLGPNPAVQRFLKSGSFDTHQYPSPDSERLRTALGKEWDLDPKCIVCGNGVDEIIGLTFQAFTRRGDRVAYPSPSFSMYSFFSRTFGTEAIEVPLNDNFSPDIEGLIKAKAKLTFIASPNNPTGNKFSVKDIQSLIDGCQGWVALDEAYIEYSGGSFLGKIKKHPRLLIFRTFSKAYAMAGLRVGVAVGTKGAEKLADIKPPFTLNVLSEAAALTALRNKAWVKRSLETINKERPRLKKALGKLGFKVYPSVTNFLLCRSPVDSRGLCMGLAKKGILIKDFGKVPGLKGHVRITIGSKSHNDLLLKRLEKVM